MKIDYEKNRLHFISEVGIAIALMTILLYIGALIPIGTSGGVLNLGMPVIVFMTIRRGILTGILLGFVMGVVHAFEGVGYLMSPSHPLMGLMLDYYLQYISLSLGGIWLLLFKFKTDKNINTLILGLVIFTSFVAALTVETFSGIIAWNNGQTGWGLIVYCIVTNYPYLLATFIVTLTTLVPLFLIGFESNLVFIKPLPKFHRKLLTFKKNNLDKVLD